MTEEQVDQPVKVISEVHAHPALRKLARACIALARWQGEQETAESARPDLEPRTADTKAVEQVEEDQHG